MDKYSEDLEYVEVTNRSKVSYKEMCHREDLSDLTIRCDEREFQVHRIILAACSPYFRLLFQKKPTTMNIVLDNVASTDLERVLHYMYHGSVEVSDQHVQGFGEILEMFMMPLPDNIEISETESEFENEAESYGNFM